MLDNKIDRIKIECVKCNEEINSFINIKTGDIDPKFCSEKCEIEYFGGEYIEFEYKY